MVSNPQAGPVTRLKRRLRSTHRSGPYHRLLYLRLRQLNIFPRLYAHSAFLFSVTGCTPTESLPSGKAFILRLCSYGCNCQAPLCGLNARSTIPNTKKRLMRKRRLQ